MIDINNMAVLIVDDMPGMCKSIRGIMKLLGYGKEFFFANNGAQAWRILEKEDIDMAIIDWNMPVMTGVELLRLIRADDRVWETPVVMVTAEADTEIVAEVAETDIDAYLLKPLTVKLLGDRVARVVANFNDPPPLARLLRSARALFKKGDVEGAIAEAQKAVELDPDGARPMRELGYYYLKNNQLAEAEKCLKTAARKNQMDVFAYNQLGELFMLRKDYANAAKYLNHAMNISPRQLERGIRLGTVLLQTGMKPQARQVFDKTISVSKEKDATREQIANICAREGDKQYAAALLDQTLQTVTTRPDLLVRLAQWLEEMGDNAEAVSRLVLASEMDKENPGIKISIARNYLAIKRPMWAEKYLNQVLKKDPGNEEAREMLRQCL